MILKKKKEKNRSYFTPHFLCHPTRTELGTVSCAFLEDLKGVSQNGPDDKEYVNSSTLLEFAELCRTFSGNSENSQTVTHQDDRHATKQFSFNPLTASHMGSSTREQ